MVAMFRPARHAAEHHWLACWRYNRITAMPQRTISPMRDYIDRNRYAYASEYRRSHPGIVIATPERDREQRLNPFGRAVEYVP